MPTTMPLIAIDATVADRRVRPAPASSRTHSAGNRAALWIVLAIVGMTIAAGVLLPASSDSAVTQGTTWMVGP